jgi:hypothetical protein
MPRRQSKSTTQKRPGTSIDRDKGSSRSSAGAKARGSQTSRGSGKTAMTGGQGASSRGRPASAARQAAELEMSPDEE